MARPRKSDAPDLGKPINLTLGAVERLTCPAGRSQAFLRDLVQPGLQVRVTAAGSKAFVFERSLRNRSIRKTIGSVCDWTIEAARAEARRLAVIMDSGADPRELERQREADRVAHAERLAAEQAAQAERTTREAITVGAAWARYCAERRPRWGARTFADHLGMVQTGGVARQRRPGVLTKPGPLAHFMPMRLIDLTPAAVDAWAIREASERPARVRLALRLLKAFLRWAASEPGLHADPAAASAKKAREAAGKAKPKRDVLERGQLAAWFERVRQIPNPIVSAYLQALLLTGARPGEVLSLRWEDVNEQWRGISIRDKVEGERMIPLTPYVARLLGGLPRRNGWVFSSVQAVSMDEANAKRRARYHARHGTEAPAGPVAPRSASGRLADPGTIHRRACAAAGLEGLTLHGLRRSFASLTEWLEVPTGVVAQIMGHKPSATAERHYKVRPLDLLRVHHERIEAWVLEQAGIEQPSAAKQSGLRVVAGGMSNGR